MRLSPLKGGDLVEQAGEYRIAADRLTVWTALNDPEVLCRSLDGCQFMNKVADDRFDAVVKAKIGPVSATFNAELELHDVRAPDSYIIHASVKGGPAGFARGQARVDLLEDGDVTVLRYAVAASVGGKLAQVGSRLIDSSARKMADDFFAAFTREVGGPVAAAAPDASAAGSAGSRSSSSFESSGSWVVWLVVFVALVIGLMFAL
jgi:uncharacterized protein